MDIFYKFAYFLSRLVGLYSTLIVIRIMFTWITVQNPNGPVMTFFRKICDPYLNLFRSKKTRIGMIDFSPILALTTLNVLQSVLSMFATYGQVSLGLIIAILLDSLWRYLFSYIFVIMIVLIAIRWFVGRNKYSASATEFVNRIEPVLYKPVHFVYKLFYNGKQVDDQKIVLTAFFFYLVVFFIVRYGLNQLVQLLCRL